MFTFFRFDLLCCLRSRHYLEWSVWIQQSFQQVTRSTNSRLCVTLTSTNSTHIIRIRIASITKVFTSLFLYRLRDLGIVNLDDPVDRYLPNVHNFIHFAHFQFSVRSTFQSTRPITLRNLASHTSGLQREVFPHPILPIHP